MTVERHRKFLGIISFSKKLKCGEVYEVINSRGFFSGMVDECKFEVLNSNMIRLRKSVDFYGRFGLTYHGVFKANDKVLFGREINDENIHGSAFLGAKEKIIWKPDK